MNWDRIQGNWKQVKGQAQQQWGKLTDDDLQVVAGHRDQMAGKIQERYGIAKDVAEKQLKAWQDGATEAWFVVASEPAPASVKPAAV
ncbi:MAG: general stress protein CsbD [Curvibacter sp. PD_MW3]|nr:CsbD family protein [Burkholderiales bacterium]PHM19013.1 MAG: general stress protein CsbD [Curvibacter sp. PD_MW3]